MESTKHMMKFISVFTVVILILQIFMPIFVYATDNIVTTEYIISDGYILDVPGETTVEELLSNIFAYSGESCSVHNGDNLAELTDIVCTGMTLTAGDSVYTIAVKGDLNKDGKNSALDLSLLMSVIVNVNTLGDAEFKAADLNHDNKLTTIDLSGLKIILVGLGLYFPDIIMDEEIMIVPSTTQPAKSVDISVIWPENLDGLTKQISVNSGRTFTNNIDEATVTENGTVIARLINNKSKVVKEARLEITNIDNEPPADFEASLKHTIANYVTLTGTTTGADKYYFSKDNGRSWYPNSGLRDGQYTFFDLTPNSTISFKMKAADEVGNETTTPSIEQRTFRRGIEILSEKLRNVNVDTVENTITLPDGRIYKLVVTSVGSYDVVEVGVESDSATISTDEIMLNEVVSEFERDETKTVEEILHYIVSGNIAEVIAKDSIITIEKANYYNMYKLVTNLDESHYVVFTNQIKKHGLTSSGQYDEEDTVEAVRAIATQMVENHTITIVRLLNKAIEDGILLEENVNKNMGRFECTNGTVYQVRIVNNEVSIELIGTAEEINDDYVAQRIKLELEKGLKEAIINWNIADGITTEALSNKEAGEFETINGQYKKVIIDMETGLYEVVDAIKPNGAKISYTLTPDFPTMASKVRLAVTSTYDTGISKIQILSEIGDVLKNQNYSNVQTANLSYDFTQNGTYIIKAVTSDGKETEEVVLISHIATLLPIRVTITPETARNTEINVLQNGIPTGPISVTLKYSDAALLNNEDKYQYQIGTTDGEWQTATKTQVINGITENSSIYARYWDGANGLKLVQIKVNNVDNVAPNEFEFSTIVTTHSITINAETTDTALDSNGVLARESISGVLRYEYSLDGINWQLNPIISDLTQTTDYTIYVKAIDYAGNERMASNNGSVVRTATVPKAFDVITYAYTTQRLTNEPVTVTAKLANDVDPTNIIEFQVLKSGENADNLTTDWKNENKIDALNNCVIYGRVRDIKGQVNPEGGYAVANVSNIDNLAPEEFLPVVTARTQTSITVSADVDDAPATIDSLSSNISSYTYNLIPSVGNVIKVSDLTSNTYTFTNLTPGKAYSIYMEAKDEAGNITISKQITATTNAIKGEFTDVTTTVYGLESDESYNNPYIPGGFRTVDEGDVSWGDGQTIPSGWNDGLVIEDKKGNQFVWVPVDGENVPYKKWTTTGMSYENTLDGTNPVNENDEIRYSKGFYVSRYEAGKWSDKIVSISGENPQTSVSYEIAKQKAEAFVDSTNAVSGLITGTQWDTLMKWISNEKNMEYVTDNTTWGNYTETSSETGSSEEWKVKNIYDIEGNVQEITNEYIETVDGNGKTIKSIVLRGGAYDVENPAAHRSTLGYNSSLTNTGFRTVLYVKEITEFEPEGNGNLGIGNINLGPGNQTINGLEASYNNPIVPVGFKAINTEDARWTGVTPSGWNDGLVIEDVNGNQFVWVPVDGNSVKYEKGTLVWQRGTEPRIQTFQEDVPASISEIGDSAEKQIEEYHGFYIARYEAGSEDGNLASKVGLKPVNAIDYDTARVYAEGMYNTLYVKSGLPTGTYWDTMTKWIENKKGARYVTKDVTSGNSYNNEFTFSGTYAIGPTSKDDFMGEYQTENDVTKPENQAYLLSTGLVNDFKVKNIYDLAGNVWEYTSEYYLLQNEKIHIARGSDFYRNENETWGIKVRETLTTPPGECRNESGFRVMLYLSDTPTEVGKFEDYNRTVNGKPASYDNPIIPAGFAAVNKGANWGNGKTQLPQWNDGLVIEDQSGNQFVWVPVDGENVPYEKWTKRGIAFKYTDGDELPSSVLEWEEEENTQIEKYGGFYISRYEISKGEENEARSIANSNSWINITWDTAKEKAESMIKQNTVTTGLITGTQWDTVLKWIANEKGEAAVIEDSSSWGNYSNSNLGKNAVAKNIYEMAGGSWEWTAEYQGNNKMFRGGVSKDSGSSSPAAYRDAYKGGAIDEAISFRTVLYITGKVVGISKKPVEEQILLKGTDFLKTINVPVLTSGMTPVKWNGSTWVPTTIEDSDWYDYADTTQTGENTSKWANVMMPDGTMFVWIPRYAYKIDKTNQEIDIVFLFGTSNTSIEDVKVYDKTSKTITTENSYVTHPAFRGDTSIGGWDRELTGIWVAKKEGASYNDRQGDHQFKDAQNATLGLTEEQRALIDIHMAKNTEWGAAAYLSVSKYGSGNSKSTTTTGNEYGIKDMTSGSVEYTSAFMKNIMPVRYQNLREFTTADLKYIQVYEKSNSYYGDAVDETKKWDNAHYSLPSDKGRDDWQRPLFIRDTGSVYATTTFCGNSNKVVASRLVLIPNK